MKDSETKFWVKKAQRHDKDAFTELMQLYMKDMYRAAIAILMNEEDAADALQDTILTCWEKLYTLKKPEFFKTWMTRILINHCYDIRRRNVIYENIESYEEPSKCDEYNIELKEAYASVDGHYRLPLELNNWKSIIAIDRRIKMSNKKTIFSEEIELSEVVLKKTNQAFEMIKQEDIGYMKKTQNKGKRLFKARAAAIAGVCILAVSSISAVAAIRHYWGRGMNGNIQATEEQQQELTENNVAKVYDEEQNSPSLAVTDNGVTIEPATVIVDERFVYMSFRISGYSVEDRMEPGFDMVNVYLGDDPEDESAWVNMSGTMYDGIIPDENGRAVYEDGTPLESYEDGSIICHYTDDNGNMEYIIQASVGHKNDSFLGRTMHVEFKNLGTVSKAAFTPVVDGNWNFEISLSDVSSTQNIVVGQKVEGTDFTMENIDISPISMKVNYSVSAAPVIIEDELGIPEVRGVVLKDGTRIPYLTDGGGFGYTDSSMANAYQMAGFDRVIDVDEVAALIVLIPYSNEKVEIPISN